MTLKQLLKNGIPVSSSPITPAIGNVPIGSGVDLPVAPMTFLDCPVLAGNTIWVDSVNGNDSTGLRGDSNKPFRTVQAALSATGITSGDVVRMRTGVYNLTAGITIPDGVDLSGENGIQTTIQMLNVTANTTAITMGNNSVFENCVLRLTTTGPHSLTGILYPSTMTARAFLRSAGIVVTKTVSVDAAAVTGVLIQTPVVTANVSTNSRGCTIIVASTGTGNNRGILQNTSAGSYTVRDTNVSCTGGGTCIGVEINVAGGSMLYEVGNITGTTADISQTAGTLAVSTDLLNNTADLKGFNSFSPTTLLVWGSEGSVNAGINRFMVPGSGPDSTIERKIRMSRTAVVKSLTMRAVIPPGLLNTCTVVVRKNGLDTAYTISLAGLAVSAQDNSTSITFAAGDDISMRIQRSAGGVADVYATVEVY